MRCSECTCCTVYSDSSFAVHTLAHTRSLVPVHLVGHAWRVAGYAACAWSRTEPLLQCSYTAAGYVTSVVYKSPCVNVRLFACVTRASTFSPTAGARRRRHWRRTCDWTQVLAKLWIWTVIADDKLLSLLLSSFIDKCTTWYLAIPSICLSACQSHTGVVSKCRRTSLTAR